MSQVGEVEDSAAARGEHEPVHDERSVPAVCARFLRHRPTDIHAAARSKCRPAGSQGHRRRVRHLRQMYVTVNN